MGSIERRDRAISLNFAQFRYTLLPDKKIRVPFLSRGHILRGAFGSSLRRLACPDIRIACQDCLIREECGYFQIINPSDLNPVRRMQDTPRGYVIKPTLDDRETFTREHPFYFDFVLVGDRIHYHPWVIVPLQNLGRIGIGPHRDRFEIHNIEAVKNGETVSIYDPETRVVKNIALTLTSNDIYEQASGLSPEKLTLKFLTPTRIRYNPSGERGCSRAVQVPEFHHLLKRLRDRINALAATYGEGALDIDFAGLGRSAEAITIADANIRWVAIKRKSRTQGTWHDQSGFVGTITYMGDLKEFLPFLVLGQYIHVGKDAVFGNGWYRILD